MKRLPINPVEAKLVFPGAYTQRQSDAVVPQMENCELVTFKAKDGVKITGHYGSGAGVALDRVVRPTLLFFYGNGTCMAHNLDIFGAFRNLGFNVMMVDYAGYGMSGGKPSEEGCYAAADLAYDYLMNRADLSNSPIIAAGWSLGGAVAIDLAARRHVAGLATFSAFTSMADMVRVFTRLPIGFLLNSRFHNLAKLSKVLCPTLLVHGTMDRLIPPKMLDRLAAVVRGKLTTVRLEGADHNDLFDYGGEDLYWRIRTFVADVTEASAITR